MQNKCRVGRGNYKNQIHWGSGEVADVWNLMQENKGLAHFFGPILCLR